MACQLMKYVRLLKADYNHNTPGDSHAAPLFLFNARFNRELIDQSQKYMLFSSRWGGPYANRKCTHDYFTYRVNRIFCSH